MAEGAIASLVKQLQSIGLALGGAAGARYFAVGLELTAGQIFRWLRFRRSNGLPPTSKRSSRAPQTCDTALIVSEKNVLLVK